MPTSRQRRTDRRAIIALFAVFALLVQAFMPAAAMAAQADQGPAQLICVGGSLQLLTADGKAPAPHKGMAGMPCQDCLAVAMAVVIPPPVAIAPVAYVVARVDHAPSIGLLAPRARAPPRPPGQGPPTA